MSELLPIGTVVDVVEPDFQFRDTDFFGNETTETREGRRYRGRVEGYDMHRSKYRLAMQLSSSKSEGGVRWSQPDMWAFPRWCTPVTEGAEK